MALRLSTRPFLHIRPHPLRTITARLSSSSSSSSSSSPTPPSHPSQPPTPSQPPNPNPNAEPISGYRQSARNFSSLSRPWAKVLLGAFLTYQLLYLGWEKLRYDEIKEERAAEIRALEEEIRVFDAKRKGNGEDGDKAGGGNGGGGWKSWFGLGR